MSDNPRSDCPDCGDESLSRRDFVRRVTGAAVAGGLLPLAASARTALRQPVEVVGRRDRRQAVLRHPDRRAEEGHLLPVRPRPPQQDQRQLGDHQADDRGVLHQGPAGAPRTRSPAASSAPTATTGSRSRWTTTPAGSAQYHVAVFGTPGSGQFEWELTGRHVTLRADGDSVANAAFGGPIVYGHGAGDGKKGLPGNVFYYQTQKANEVFKALDGKQRDAALVAKAPKETAVLVQGELGPLPRPRRRRAVGATRRGSSSRS